MASGVAVVLVASIVTFATAVDRDVREEDVTSRPPVFEDLDLDLGRRRLCEQARANDRSNADGRETLMLPFIRPLRIAQC